MDGAQDGKALSYQRIQEWPSLQLAISNSLQNKATFIWTAATAVIGIAVPLGLNSPSVLSSHIGWLLAVALSFSGLMIYVGMARDESAAA